MTNFDNQNFQKCTFSKDQIEGIIIGFFKRKNRRIVETMILPSLPTTFFREPISTGKTLRALTEEEAGRVIASAEKTQLNCPDLLVPIINRAQVELLAGAE